MLKDKTIKNLFIIFLSTRILYLLFQFIFTIILNNNFVDVFYFMDSSNYLHIAKYGYNEDKYYAFFPLIPILIKLFGLYGVVILNNILSFLSSIFLYKLFNKETAILFLLSPIQIFCYIPYTESIFIFLSILTFYLYKNKKYFYMGISLGLGVCCRSMTSMLFFSIFIDFIINIKNKKNEFKNLIITFIPATIISCLYPLYLYVKTNNWKYFVDVQYKYWDAKKSNIFKVLFEDVKSFFIQDIYGKYLILLTYVALILLLLVFIKYKKVENVLILYTLFTILITFSTCKNLYLEASFPPSTSYFRYFLSCFPLYVGLSYLKHNKLIKTILIFLNIIISINFILNGWPF